MGVKFRLRSLLILTAFTALTAFGVSALKHQLDGIDRAYWRESFDDGRVTREEARAVVGDVVDIWGEPKLASPP